MSKENIKSTSSIFATINEEIVVPNECKKIEKENEASHSKILNQAQEENENLKGCEKILEGI